MKCGYIIFWAFAIVGCNQANQVSVNEDSNEKLPAVAETYKNAAAGTETGTVNEPDVVQKIAEVPKDIRDIDEAEQFFNTRVPWPEFDSATAEKAVYAIESGSNSEGAWFEGKGFFRGNIEQFVRDMNDPLIMGPSNVTKALSRRNATDGDVKHRYDLHVEMDYIFTVEFDLTVDIDVSADGIHYESHKTNGTSMIKRIDEIIAIRKISDDWFGVAFQSRYDALVVKERETREHFEELFARWGAENTAN